MGKYKPKMAIMFDCETLGLGRRAVILQIGAVTVDLRNPTYEPVNKFIVNIDSKDSVAAGRTVDEGTVAFWKRQPEKVRESVFNADGKRTFKDGIECFYEWILTCQHLYGKDITVWVNGITADINWTETAFEDLGMRIPWKYSVVRDFRTLNRFHPTKWEVQVGYNGQDLGKAVALKHNALYDADTQARHLHKIYHTVKGAHIKKMIDDEKNNHSGAVTGRATFDKPNFKEVDKGNQDYMNVMVEW